MVAFFYRYDSTVPGYSKWSHHQPAVVNFLWLRFLRGCPRQTDDTPCISANGENICRALAQGEMRCAANFVPLGSHLYVDKIGVCLVTDRMNRRYRNRVDIAMQKDEYRKARRFGKQKLHVKILDSKITKN